MNILIICTSNKDRSPTIASHLQRLYPEHNYRSAGINRYFTGIHGTHLVTIEDIIWSEQIICCSDVHKDWIGVNFLSANIKPTLTLNLGRYKSLTDESVDEIYLKQVVTIFEETIVKMVKHKQKEIEVKHAGVKPIENDIAIKSIHEKHDPDGYFKNK